LQQPGLEVIRITHLVGKETMGIRWS